MFGSGLPPANTSPPPEPCLECLAHGEHSHGGRLVTCDPLMAAIGMWVARQEAVRRLEVEDLRDQRDP